MRVPCFDYAPQHLETFGDGDVVQDEMGRPQLAVCVDEHLGL